MSCNRSGERNNKKRRIVKVGNPSFLGMAQTRLALAGAVAAAAIAIVGIVVRQSMHDRKVAAVKHGTARMVQRLAGIAQSSMPDSGHNNAAKIAQMRHEYGVSPDVVQQSNIGQRIGWELLIAGQPQQALDEYRSLSGLLQEYGTPGALETSKRLRFNIALAALRIGEQENCVHQHNCESCLAPILSNSLAVHAEQRGSRMALDALTAILDDEPDNLSARWLLNLAYMTLGEYPHSVPAKWRIPPDVFRSEHALPRFFNVASHLGVDVVGLSGGVASEDFDQDGWIDLVVSSMGLSDQLRYFHNDGHGRFEEWTERAGLVGIVGGLNVCHADYDNDGYSDVLVLRGGWLRDQGMMPPSLLRNNRDGTFDDLTEQAGLMSLRPTQTAAWGDFDGDGWLDLFIGTESWPPSRAPCQLYHNNRNGTFSDCAAELGLGLIGVIKGVAWGDINNDGRPDLYVSRYGEPNLLFRNDGAAEPDAAIVRDRKRRWWRFEEIGAAAGVTEPEWSFPTWFWDYDNDGWQDLMVFGYDQSRPQLANVVADYMGQPREGPTPRLYRNRRDGTFENVTSAVGLDRVLLAMGCNFGDLDNDGYLDFYVGTGDPKFETLIPNRMFRNDRGQRFQDVTTAGGFGHLQKGHGVAFADFDNDGDQDVYCVLGGFYVADIAHNALFENPGNSNHWITMRLEGRRSNRSAIGARIQIDLDTPTGPRSIFATVGTGGSFGSSGLQQEVGLGDATSIRQVTVTWPTSGVVDRYSTLPLDHVVWLREGDASFRAESPRPASLTPSRGREPPHRPEPSPRAIGAGDAQ